MASEIITVYECKDYKVFYQAEPYHRYWKQYKDGREEKIPSVTAVTGIPDKSRFLIPWAAGLTATYIIDRIPDIITGKLILTPDDAKKMWYQARAESDRVKKEAADYGTLIHAAVEQYLKAEYMGIGKSPIDMPDAVRKSLNGFKRIAKELKLKRVLAVEQIVYSPTYNVGGTIDIVGEFDGKIYIADLKTSPNFYPEMIMQFSAYREMWNETYEEQAEGIRGIRLDKKDWLPYTQEFTDQQDLAFQKFLALLEYQQLPEIQT